jgi:exoribonuclease II
MLPEKLSTNLTSLNPDEDRLAVVVEMTVAADGSVTNPAVYRAKVRNRAQLAYNGCARPSAGTASWRWRRKSGRSCRRCPTPLRSTRFCMSGARQTTIALPIFRCRS